MANFLTLLLITGVCVVLQYPQLQDMTIWDVRLIHSGEWWRIVTGNFTHTNRYHLAMNMAALWLMSYLFSPSAKSLVVLLLINSAAIGIALESSDLTQYAGLSGVLHGIFVYYAGMEIYQGRRSSWLLLIGVVGKIAYEQVYGASPVTAELIGARVAIQAHLAGGLCGGIAVIVMLIKRHLSAKQIIKQKGIH